MPPVERKTKKKIKPCPFCGGEARLEHPSGPYMEPYKGASMVECTNCHAMTRSFSVATEYSSDDKAIEAWNRRVKDQ